MWNLKKILTSDQDSVSEKNSREVKTFVKEFKLKWKKEFGSKGRRFLEHLKKQEAEMEVELETERKKINGELEVAESVKAFNVLIEEVQEDDFEENFEMKKIEVS